MEFGWVSLETVLPTCHLTSHANHRYHAIRDEDRRHARGRLRRYDRDLDSGRVGPPGALQQRLAERSGGRPSWRRREMQRGWRGSGGCGVAAAVGEVCCVMCRAWSLWVHFTRAAYNYKLKIIITLYGGATAMGPLVLEAPPNPQPSKVRDLFPP